MLRIRLRRVGKKKAPAYRILVIDSHAPRDGAYVEQVGLYNPMPDPPSFSIEEDKVLKWLKNGAKPSEAVARLLQKKGLLEKSKQP